MGESAERGAIDIQNLMHPNHEARKGHDTPAMQVPWQMVILREKTQRHFGREVMRRRRTGCQSKQTDQGAAR